MKSKSQKRLIICDIDGTIADIRPRLAKAGPEPKRRNKRAFQFWLDRIQNEKTLARDNVLEPVRQMLEGLLSKSGTTEAFYLTGRSERFRKVTSRWLKKFRLPKLPLLMRPEKDWRAAAAFKQEIIRKLVQEIQPQEVICLDDDGGGDCSRMYLKNGWVHIHIKTPEAA